MLITPQFLEAAQDTLSSTASSYDISTLLGGVLIASLAVGMAVFSLDACWTLNAATIFFALTTLLYGVMMFASSYVEEEQQFWYWVTSTWIACLAGRR